MVAQKSSSIAASSGVKCATVFAAASTFFSNDATVAEERAARPRLLPASARKSRRVRSRTMELEIVTKREQRDEELAADLFSVGYPAVSQERVLEHASEKRNSLLALNAPRKIGQLKRGEPNQATRRSTAERS